MPADLDMSPHARPCKSVSATGRERPGRRRAAKSVAHVGNSARMSVSRWGRGKCEERTGPTAGISAGGVTRGAGATQVMVSLRGCRRQFDNAAVTARGQSAVSMNQIFCVFGRSGVSAGAGTVVPKPPGVGVGMGPTSPAAP